MKNQMNDDIGIRTPHSQNTTVEWYQFDALETRKNKRKGNKTRIGERADETPRFSVFGFTPSVFGFAYAETRRRGTLSVTRFTGSHFFFVLIRVVPRPAGPLHALAIDMSPVARAFKLDKSPIGEP